VIYKLVGGDWWVVIGEFVIGKWCVVVGGWWLVNFFL